MDEIKEWKAENYLNTVCHYLLREHVAFSYSEERGLVFTAPVSFVCSMRYNLQVAYACGKIQINELSKK